MSFDDLKHIYMYIYGIDLENFNNKENTKKDGTL